MRSAIIAAVLAIVTLTGCGSGGGGGGGSSGSSSTPAPATSTTYLGTVTDDTLGASWAAIGETDTEIEVKADGTIVVPTDHLGRIERASGSEWTGAAPVSGYLLRLTYDATAKTVEVRRVTNGQRVVWTLGSLPASRG